MGNLKVNSIHSIEASVETTAADAEALTVKSGRVIITEAGATNISGQVFRGDAFIASFNTYGAEGAREIRMPAQSTPEADAAILAAITLFITAVSELRPAAILAATAITNN